MKPLSIGQLSKKTGVKITTIRYYESIGLIQEPDRSETGRRLYNDEAVQILTFIKHSRDLGFSMNAIEKLLALQGEPGQDCSVAGDIVEGQLYEVQKRLRQLQALELELRRILRACKGGQVGDCGILSTLNDHGECIADDHERLDFRV